MFGPTNAFSSNLNTMNLKNFPQPCWDIQDLEKFNDSGERIPKGSREIGDDV